MAHVGEMRGSGHDVGERPALDGLGGARHDVGLVTDVHVEPLDRLYAERDGRRVDEELAGRRRLDEDGIADVDLSDLRASVYGPNRRDERRPEGERTPEAAGSVRQLHPQPPPRTEPPPNDASRFSSTCSVAASSPGSPSKRIVGSASTARCSGRTVAQAPEPRATTNSSEKRRIFSMAPL